MKIPKRFYYDLGASIALLLRSCRFCCDSRHFDQNFESSSGMGMLGAHAIVRRLTDSSTSDE